MCCLLSLDNTQSHQHSIMKLSTNISTKGTALGRLYLQESRGQERSKWYWDRGSGSRIEKGPRTDSAASETDWLNNKEIWLTRCCRGVPFCLVWADGKLYQSLRSSQCLSRQAFITVLSSSSPRRLYLDVIMESQDDGPVGASSKNQMWLKFEENCASPQLAVGLQWGLAASVNSQFFLELGFSVLVILSLRLTRQPLYSSDTAHHGK